MILADTSIWIDHLRCANSSLVALMEAGHIAVHPFVIGEIAMGNLTERRAVLDALAGLPDSIVASDAEVLHFIDSAGLFGLGIGYVDAHLLTAARLGIGTLLWTRDKRLAAAAHRLNIALPDPGG